MEFKDYYATLGIAAGAAQADVKRAYRKQARKYHPDVSKEPDAEARFKDITEANEALSDVEKRAAYDEVVAQRNRQPSGRDFSPPPGWDSGFEFSGREASYAPDASSHSDFFEALFGRRATAARGPHPTRNVAGGDHHAKVQIELRDAYRGGIRSVALRMPQIDAQGHVTLQTRQLDVVIPRGIHSGQHLRLAGQGGAGSGGDAPAGDLYLEIEFAPTPDFRVEGRDVYLGLPVAPWEAALGAEVDVTTPDGSVQLKVPSGSSTGRSLRLKGQGIPGVPPGDLYAVLSIALPKAETATQQAAYRAFAEAFAEFSARPTREVPRP